MSCVCCSHVGECCAGHVLYSSPNLDATNICLFLFFFLPAPSPKGLSVSTLIPAVSNILNQPCHASIPFITKCFIQFFFSFISACCALKTPNIRCWFSFCLVRSCKIVFLNSMDIPHLSSAASCASQQFRILCDCFTKLALIEMKGKILVFAGWSQCPHPCSTAHVLLHWIKRILQRGHELLWKTSMK